MDMFWKACSGEHGPKCIFGNEDRGEDQGAGWLASQSRTLARAAAVPGASG
ncbi:hypothetical protein SAMN02745121_05314 [Nannocystis exedens]|uniref:Uncharacterized protein n=1 Tax=Nannocystis exedens TaxID=54 RepID=A0A1I2CX52_9BACT|nr:hypothetical protein NAEX_01656 [Nannocystis exedens]SFE72881.1 hypothetical protein SAMN02745121_05314 [Nannocystis exedens]